MLTCQRVCSEYRCRSRAVVGWNVCGVCSLDSTPWRPFPSSRLPLLPSLPLTKATHGQTPRAIGYGHARGRLTDGRRRSGTTCGKETTSRAKEGVTCDSHSSSPPSHHTAFSSRRRQVKRIHTNQVHMALRPDDDGAATVERVNEEKQLQSTQKIKKNKKKGKFKSVGKQQATSNTHHR